MCAKFFVGGFFFWNPPQLYSLYLKQSKLLHTRTSSLVRCLCDPLFCCHATAGRLSRRITLTLLSSGCLDGDAQTGVHPILPFFHTAAYVHGSQPHMFAPITEYDLGNHWASSSQIVLIFCSVITSALADELRLILTSYTRMCQTLLEYLDGLHIALPAR